MKKRTILIICMLMSIILLSGCNSILGGEEKKTQSRTGMQYYFDGKMFNTATIEILDGIEFHAPSMEGMIKDNLRIYQGENSALILWIDEDKKNVNIGKIISEYADTMVENIESVAQIDNVGVQFDMELLAKDKVNDIDRYKYIGVISAIGKDGVDVELNTVVYTMKIGKYPAYIMGVVTNRAQEKSEFVEIETNAQIMANTIKKD